MQRFYGNDPHIIRKRRRSVRAPKGGKTGRSGRKFAVVAVLLSVILLFSVAFGAGGSKTVVRVKRKEWYFVSVLTAADSGQANVKALDIRSRGGAGYIYNDGDFSVIASVYPTEREAKAVAVKQPDPATIIKIAFSETEFPPGEYDAAVKAALALPADVVAMLTGAAYDFEKGNLSESEVSFRLDSVGKEAAKLATALESSETTASAYAKKILDVVSAVIGSSDDDKESVLSSRLRCAACGIVYEVSELSAIYAGLQLPKGN